MARDGFLCFLGFQNFPGEGPRTPLSKVCCKFTVQHCSTQDKAEKKEDIQLKEWTSTQSGSTSLICDLLAKDLLYPLLVKYRGGKDPARKFNVNLLFVFIRISVKQPLLRLK